MTKTTTKPGSKPVTPRSARLSRAKLDRQREAMQRVVSGTDRFAVIHSTVEAAIEHNLVPAMAATLAFSDPRYNQGINYGPGINDKTDDSAYTEHLNAIVRLMCLSVEHGRLCILNSVRNIDATIRAKLHPHEIVVWRERFAQYNRRGLTQEWRALMIEEWGDNPPPMREDALTRYPSERMRMGDKRAAGPRLPGNVWDTRRLQGTSTDRVPGFPCQLPPEPLALLVRLYTRPGDLIVEPCCGPGSLGRVAVALGRRYIGIDASLSAVRVCRFRCSQADLDYVHARHARSWPASSWLGPREEVTRAE